ncbi:1-deoxy-D-xylulose-5-phosphate reductoisomerase [Pseudoalteromonas luteoviolacea]|uniref:1-deoxy-D-xylulose-5-phosphate reductoisomerase n=1 Tax=Pseudoalteromonas luteoviolacea TaxID=43657 RepID=UPI001B369C6A|nr:1-deoxy-D-xylulose-5-phosphate reductoisomerase [Pseudoalteromonas luteoviolacea]MBQ4810385.1 1-deoxy-D-xylulose-5-phosphate reductoisomerase [Pseudoalteromonas luteoviolacea]
MSVELSQLEQVVILGASGSIGTSTLDVISRNKERYDVFALVAGSNVEVILKQALEYKPRYVVMQEAHAATSLREHLSNTSIEVLSGTDAMCDIAAHPDVDIVMSAIVGAAGLLPTLAAVEAGKKVLLANKESLVMSGKLFMDKVKHHGATLLPIDSEHNAIFQCMPAQVQRAEQTNFNAVGIRKILLTGSGGPFLTRDVNTLKAVTVEEAVAHPNWSMGRKISVDSATMMNKGLEFIEAKWLFDCQPDDIEVVIHPQSMIHSMVQYQDGSVIAQMGQPDMRTPIAYGLAYPERIDAGVKPLDFSDMRDFTFTHPDYARYPNLKLAIEACRLGQAATTALNAANEISVAAFLDKRIGFMDIFRVNEQVLEHSTLKDLESLEEILDMDSQARRLAQQMIANQG